MTHEFIKWYCNFYFINGVGKLILQYFTMMIFFVNICYFMLSVFKLIPYIAILQCND